MLYEFALNDAALWVRGESRAGNLIKGEYYYSKWEIASAENVVSKQKWLNCTLQLCLWRMQERHFSFPSSLIVFLFSAGLQQNSNCQWSNSPAEKTHAHKGYWSCCKPYFALLCPVSYENGILILGDQRSSKTFIYFSLTNVGDSPNFPRNLK